MARLRSAPTVAPPKVQDTRQALKEKTNTTRAKAAPADEDLGNIDGLIKEGKERRGRPRKSAHGDDEVVMAGGLGQQETSVPRRDLGPTSTDELAKRDALVPSTAKANRRPPRMTRKPIQNEAQSRVLDGLRKRMEETARKETGKKGTLLAVKRPSIGTAHSSNVLPTATATVRKSAAGLQEGSEYDVSPSPPPPGKLNSLRGNRSSLVQPTSSPKPRSTPAMDTSVLKNFKRRARQPSMLAMVQQRVVSARPSTANAAAAEEDPSIFDFDSVEDEDDFAPEAEGTPLNASKAKRKSAGSSSKKPAAKATEVKAAPTSRKRKSQDTDHSSRGLETLAAKRRKSEVAEPSLADVNDPITSFAPMRTTRRPSNEIARQATPIPQDASEIHVINSSPSTVSSAEPPSPNTQRRSLDADFAVPSTEVLREELLPRADDGLLNDDGRDNGPNGTMAEPASSSPMPEILSDTQQRIQNELADPVTQLSPQPVTEKAAKPAKVKPISTATLQNLLPKRRQPMEPRHRKSEYDFTTRSNDEGEVDSRQVEDDDDDSGVRRRRQTRDTPAKTRKKTSAAATSKSRKATQQSNRKSSAAPSAKNPTKTYGRAPAAPVASDKENDGEFDALDEDQEDIIELPLPDRRSAEAKAKSNELEEAKRKFAEVDEWDMEFESVGAEEHRSSSQQWR